MPISLPPAIALARRSALRFPNESEDYRRARTALLAEEIDLRRHIERVSRQRRLLPPGGAVTGEYRFEGAAGPVDFGALFGGRDTLIVYSYMLGPERERPCPMDTNLLSSWDGIAPDLMQNAALAVIARSDYPRLADVGKERGWRHLPLFSDLTGAYSRDYHGVSAAGEDSAALNIFSRRDGIIRHFWAAEMTAETADPGQDARGAPDLSPLWALLDCTPDGRDPEWYPALDY